MTLNAPRSRLAVATFGILFLSALVPIVAALRPGKPLFSLVVIDLALAALLVACLALLHQRARSAVTTEARAVSYDICRWTAIIPLLLFVLYAMGVTLKWDVLLIGLGWRCWYLVTILPFALSVRGRAF